uniref:Uncharacterized protein n=1 Tax=Knipowitschia caucasica TaxID=637954 RepID=A0AAV2K7W0_KNICA
MLRLQATLWRTRRGDGHFYSRCLVLFVSYQGGGRHYGSINMKRPDVGLSGTARLGPLERGGVLAVSGQRHRNEASNPSARLQTVVRGSSKKSQSTQS